MGAEPPAPWSRWDGPGTTYNPPPLIQQPFGDTGINGNSPFAQPFIGTTGTPILINGIFTGQSQDDPLDSNYLQCFYRDANNPALGTAFLECAKSVGCCTTDCCEDTSWVVKYAWAIALVIVFGVIIIIAVIVWLASWCFSRNKDKQQKQELLASSQSGGQSQISGAYPASGAYMTSGAYPTGGVYMAGGGYPASVNNGYYPYVGGPTKYNDGRF